MHIWKVLKSYLDVKMYNVVLMHVSKTVADLLDVVDDLSFSHLVIFISDAIKEFPSRKAER